MAYGREKFASFLKKELGVFILREFPHDLDIVLSVTDVLLNSSSEEAEAHISIFPRKFSGNAIKELRNFRGEARKYLAMRLKRRRIPQIKFVSADLEKEERLEKLLEKVKNK